MKSGALKIVIINAAAGLLWIALSVILILILEGPKDYPIIFMGSASGMGYLLVTGLILFRLINYHNRRLQESEKEYRSYFEGNPTPMWIYDSITLEFMAVNDAAVISYGYSREEFCRMSIVNIRSAGEAEKIFIAEGNNASNYKDSGIWRHKRKDGTDIYAHITSNLISSGKAGRTERVMVMAQDITLRLQAQRQLQEANAELKRVNEVLSVQKNLLSESQRISKLGGWEYYVGSKLVVCSEIIFDILNFTSAEEEDPLKNLIKRLHPEDKDKFLHSQQELELNHVSIDMIFRVCTLFGSVKYIRQIARMEFAGGKPFRVNGSMQDITEIKQMEEQRNDYLLKLEDTLENMNDAFFTLDRQWNIRSVNAMFETITGFTKRQVVNKNFLQLWPETRNLYYYENVNKVFEKKATIKFEEYNKLFQKWLRVVIYPTKEGAAIFFADITVTKEKDIQLKQALERYDLVALVTQDILYDYDLVNHKLSYSQSSGNFSKRYLSDQEDPLKEWLRLIHPDDFRKMIGANAKALKDGENKFECEYRVDIGNQQYHYVQDHAYIIFDENNKPARMTGAIRDINELKEKEDSLLRQNNILSEIAWVESHEFRRPLSSILGLVDLIHLSTCEDEKKEILNYIDISAKELDAVIRKRNIVIAEVTD